MGFFGAKRKKSTSTDTVYNKHMCNLLLPPSSIDSYNFHQNRPNFPSSVQNLVEFVVQGRHQEGTGKAPGRHQEDTRVGTRERHQEASGSVEFRDFLQKV